MTIWMSRAAAGWTAIFLCGVAALGAGPDDSKTDARKAEAVLRRMADYYKKAKSFTVDVKLAQKIGPTTRNTTVAAAFERPNKLAIRVRGVLLAGTDIFSDGKTLTISIAAAKKYTQSQAPASLADMSPDDETQGMLMGTVQGSLILELTADDPYKALMEWVKTSDYLGEEVVDGGKVLHVKCTQVQFDWEVWIAAEGDPVLRKVVMDMTKSAANSPASAQVKGHKVDMVATFKGWKVDAPMDEKTFAFEPPAGAQKVDSPTELFSVCGGGGRGQEERY
jgi:hypothetical protein